jgi:hypothetical protein
VACAAETGEGLGVGRELAGLSFTLDGHGEHEGEGVLSCPGGAGEDERVGKAAGTDGGAEALDGGSVAEEVVEAGGERVCGVHGSLDLSSSINGSGAIEIVRLGDSLRRLSEAIRRAISQLLEVFMIIGRNRHTEGRHLMESAIFRLATYVLNKI